MIVVMRRGAEQSHIEAVLRRIEVDTQPVHVFHGEERVVIAILGEAPSDELGEALEVLPGVEEVGRTTRPHRLASREVKPVSSQVRIGSATLGGDFVLAAGVARLRPAAELVELAREAECAGASLLWLGRPQGAELALVLPVVAELRSKAQLPLLVEVWGPDEIDPLGAYCDGLLVGPQHLESYPLIKAASRMRRPVVLSRGPATDVEEWLLVAEQLLKGGNFEVVLCEQGIRTFEAAVHSTLDFSALAVIKRLSHLPIVANPSLAAGRREVVPALALGAAAAGADGVLVDIHLGAADEPTAGPQSLPLEHFRELAERLAALTQAMDRLSALATG
jgi:3-deoxy-7-phosphoheptulonate synthase